MREVRTRLRAARWLVLAAVTTASLTAAACGAVSDDDESEPAASRSDGGFAVADEIEQRVKDGERLRIVVSYHDPSIAFAAPLKAGVEQAAKELDVDADFVGPAGGDPDQQVNQIETLLAQGKMDGLAVSATSNDAITPVVDRAVGQGVPTISFNTDNPKSKQLGFVGQQLKESGRVEAEELIKLLDGKQGKVVVFSVDTGAGWSADRFAGFKEGMAAAKGIKVVGPVDTGGEPQESYNKVENSMKANADAIAIASLDCCSFTAAQRWVEENGKKGEVVLVGHDVLPDTVKAVKSGVAAFTLSQNPQKQGYEAVKVLVDGLRDGGRFEGVDTGIQVLTSENIDSVPIEG
jgi:simple sugar transport system substrate-binding protein/ribose transport system substrate-binding protein